MPEQTTQTSLKDINELRAQIENAQSAGKYFQPSNGESIIDYSIDAKPQVRTNQYGKKQMLINIHGVDNAKFPDGPKEWWVSINSPLALALVDKVDNKLNGTAKINRFGQGKDTKYELLE